VASETTQQIRKGEAARLPLFFCSPYFLLYVGPTLLTLILLVERGTFLKAESLLFFLVAVSSDYCFVAVWW
jgi:hypothetical protein